MFVGDGGGGFAEPASRRSGLRKRLQFSSLTPSTVTHSSLLSPPGAELVPHS